jgi:hypothetical protein
MIAEFQDLKPVHIKASLEYARELADIEVSAT